MKQIKLYTTPSCTSCKAMKPELEDFCIINDIELMIVDAEVEDIPDYVTKVPTVDYLVDGMVVNTSVGPMNKEQILSFINDL